ncbi:MAG: hypothetical protein Fur0032_20290 [Terrimicrobiaceae bacterium]
MGADRQNLIAHGDIDLWIRPAGPTGRDPISARQQNERSLKDLVGVLEKYTTLPAEIPRREGGKPYLPDGPGFNMSHSAGGTAVAVSGFEVGVDIEGEQRRVHSREIAGKFFTPRECGDLAAGNWQNFLVYWVLKEAVTKLTGDGIYRSLRDVEVVSGGVTFRGQPVWTHLFRGGGLVGALASWEPRRVNVFAIDEILITQSICHFRI